MSAERDIRNLLKNADKKHLLVIAVVIAAILVSFVLYNEQSTLPPEEVNPLDTSNFSVHFIDVGQGDCTLVKSEYGNMLIDAGENGNERTILEYLREYEIDSIKYLVATHPHSDHIGGVAEVLREVNVENIIMPRLSAENIPTTSTYEQMLNEIKNSGAKVIAAAPGKSYSFGEVNFTVLSPFEQDSNLNNMSVSLKLTYKDCSFVLTGDAEKPVEKQILSSGADIQADVYKAAHHGSSTSNSEAFVSAVNPSVVVMSYAAGNTYGHPHDEVVDLLESMQIPYYSTARYGNIVFYHDGTDLIMLTER